MKPLLVLFLSMVLFEPVMASDVYSKAYGQSVNPAIIFIHGGPSGNSNLFEGTTAQKLADNGFYVIVYDRRGEGRSKDKTATMTFEESFKDLLTIYDRYFIEEAVILGHSFGGIIATLFTARYPERVSSLILAGALFSQQETYDHILKEGRRKFRRNQVKLNEITAIEQLDKNSALYRKSCYELASELKHFTMPDPTEESIELRREFEKSEYFKTNYRNHQSPLIFYKNESRNNLDNRKVLKDIQSGGIPVYAVYGKNDGIFSKKQLTTMRHIVGNSNMKLLDNCSHYLFADQPAAFLKFIKSKLVMN